MFNRISGKMLAIWKKKKNTTKKPQKNKTKVNDPSSLSIQGILQALPTLLDNFWIIFLTLKKIWTPKSDTKSLLVSLLAYTDVKAALLILTHHTLHLTYILLVFLILNSYSHFHVLSYTTMRSRNNASEWVLCIENNCRNLGFFHEKPKTNIAKLGIIEHVPTLTTIYCFLMNNYSNII